MMEQPAKILLHANFSVNPTEGSNVSGRRLSQIFFREGEARGAAPVQEDNVSKLASAELGSNPFPPFPSCALTRGKFGLEGRDLSLEQSGYCVNITRMYSS